VRPDDAVRAGIEHLLGDELVHLRAVRRNAHDGRDLGREARALDDLAAIQHVLQAVTQGGNVKGAVLHFDHDAVPAFGGELQRGGGVGRAEAHHRVLALLERLDDAVQAGNFHCRFSCVFGRGPGGWLR
jgi:hypothetical protein